MSEHAELWAWVERNAAYRPKPHLSLQQNRMLRQAEVRLIKEVKGILERHPAPRSRKKDPKTSKAAEKATRITAGSQKHLLLAVYSAAPEGLTADEAAVKMRWERSGVGYWKRVSDLINDGFIVDTGDTRAGLSGQKQRVCRITEEGIGALRKIL